MTPAEYQATRTAVEAAEKRGREQGHQEAVETVSRLVTEDLCRCIGCLDEALEALRG